MLGYRSNRRDFGRVGASVPHLVIGAVGEVGGGSNLASNSEAGLHADNFEPHC